MNKLLHKPILCALRLHSWRINDHSSSQWHCFSQCIRCGARLEWPTKLAYAESLKNKQNGVFQGTGWLHEILKKAGKVVER